MTTFLTHFAGFTCPEGQAAADLKQVLFLIGALLFWLGLSYLLWQIKTRRARVIFSVVFGVIMALALVPLALLGSSKVNYFMPWTAGMLAWVAYFVVLIRYPDDKKLHSIVFFISGILPIIVLTILSTLLLSGWGCQDRLLNIFEMLIGVVE